MSGEEFMVLLAELKPYIAPDYTSPNFCALSAEKKLAVMLMLYYLKDTGFLQMTGSLPQNTKEMQGEVVILRAHLWM